MDDDGLDPHDFYRLHQDPLGSGLMAGLGQGDIRVDKRGERGPNHSEKSVLSPLRSQGTKVAPLATRIINNSNPRYASPSTADRALLSTTISTPALLSAAQRRQTSVRELANKFNETADEVPPVPRKSGSRSPSVGSNAARQTSRTRPATRSKRAEEGDVRVAKGIKAPKSPNPYQRRGRTPEASVTSPSSKGYQRLQQDTFHHTQPLASQSMVDLAPEIDALPRRPLFGEVLGAASAASAAGYGIPPPRRRRGSDGSMHTPNPMFSDSSTQNSQVLDDAPTGPQFTDGAQQEGQEDVMDLSSAGHLSNTQQTNHAHQVLPHHRNPADFHAADASGPSSPETPRHNAQSRIPISTRRLSAVSDSGNSSPSSRNNSAVSMTNFRTSASMSPTRTRAPPPKPLQNSSYSHLDKSQLSPRRGDNFSAHQRATSPRLNAYISAPMPKKSPPLRSSRPRQPVSNASTSASRARAVEKFSAQEALNQLHKREHRPRRPRELDNVDIDARKEAIQRSYTKKIGERERRAEEAHQRRASLAQEAARTAQKTEGTPQQGLSEQAQGETVELPSEERPKERENGEGGEVTRLEKIQPEKELTIDTGHLAERSVLDLSMEDSPTLGNFGRFASNEHRGGQTSSQSDAEPSSAITAGTSDSLDTFFDDEPQEDDMDDSHQQMQDQIALTQLGDIGRSRSPSPIRVETNLTPDASSDRDDESSIQIMLSETPILERPPSRSHFVETPTETPSNQDPNSRWSLTSRDSSERSGDLSDSRQGSVDEQMPSESKPPAHLSVSTTPSDRYQVPWSPSSFASPRTARTTMDSDTYSTVNRVLDIYHDPNIMSPELMQDVRHLIQSPNLARQGGWDPKKVTQLYLQQFMGVRHLQPNAQSADEVSGAIPTISTAHMHKKSSSTPTIVPPSEKELRDDLDGKIVQQVEERVRNQTVLSTQNLQPDEGELKPARASLSRPEDWNISPSLGGYDQQAADSPATEKPSLPANAWTAKRSASNLSPRHDDGSRPLPTEGQPRLPEIEMHDLKINVEPHPDSQHAPPPPLPPKSPPLPPTIGLSQQTSQSFQARSPPSPSEYSKHVPSSAYPGRVILDEAERPLVSVNGQHPPPLLSTPVRESNSSIISQDQPSLDGLSGSTEVASKTTSPSPEQKRLTKRAHILRELVDTEHSFCQDMKVVDDIYKGTSNVIIISPEDVKTLFGNSDQIVAFSSNFLDALKHASKSVYVLSKAKRWRSNRISSNTTHSNTTDDQSSISGPELTDDEKDRKTFIGEAFGHHMTAMEKVYADYLKNHDSANQKLQALQKNPKVQIWLKECRAYATDLTTAWDLDSLLVKPVQRILKYPLLLDQMIEVTPENHPDYTALDIAAREMKGISHRINEMKKRADLLEQVSNSSNRKRKDSEARIGFPKAFGRRTEKLRQQVGLSDMVEDKAYTAIREKFGTHFFQIQVVMRDVEMYTNDIQVFMNRFCDFASAMEAHIEVSQTSYPEVESKWRKFRMSTRDLAKTALTEHVSVLHPWI